MTHTESPNHQPGEPFRLLQISDCHLSQDPATLYRGKSADAGLESLLPGIAAWRPHLVLATGDLSEDASAASYQRLGYFFRRLAVPVLALPGNHDDDLLMQQHFPHGPWDGPLVIQAGVWQLILLKSTLAGRIDGAITQADIQSVCLTLGSMPKKLVLLALHHQPVPVGATWIDRYMLQNPGALLDLVEEHEQVVGVLWGHVHQAFETRLAATRLLACPSTAANSKPATEKFEHDPAGPACRWLQLHPQGQIETGLLFAE